MVSSEDRNRRRLRRIQSGATYHSNPGRGRSLRPLLVYIDESLMKQRPDVQRPLVRRFDTVDSRKVGLEGFERQRHTEDADVHAYVNSIPCSLEPREKQFDLSDIHLLYTI